MRRSVVLVFLLLALSTALATSYPLTVKDALGRSVTLTHAPQRIVSMIPSSTETVCAEDACDRLVGVDQFSNDPASVRELPHLGSGLDPNIEALVALKPDLVLADASSKELVAKLTALGIPVYAGTPQSYQQLFPTFRVIGRLIDEQTPAAVLVGRVQGAVDAVARLTAGLPKPTVYLELDKTPYSVGPTSYIGQLIAKAGGKDIVPARLGHYPQLDPAFIIQQNPDVILLADAPFGVSPASVAARPGWGALKAVRTGKVIALSQRQIDELNRPGPRVVDAVEFLARILHPGAFPR